LGKRENTRVAYLFGTGATQAEVAYGNKNVGLLMRDIKDGIRTKIKASNALTKRFKKVMNDLIDDKSDVEQLITLYEASGTREHKRLANELKIIFRQEIQERVQKLGLDFFPTLYASLIDMHEIVALKESIVGILTINYESLLETGVMAVKDGVDYSIVMTNEHTTLKTCYKNVFPLLKMHGSFNWKNAFPIVLKDDGKIRDADDTLWIPPGAEKKHDRYPFDILWGRAMEVLECDILRVIGCSLNRNDWQLISLLHRTQKTRMDRRQYEIELIDYADTCRSVQNNYNYLQFRLISQIFEVRESVIGSLGRSFRNKEKESKAIEQFLENKHLNMFDFWLHAKGEYLNNSGISIRTAKKIFENYMDVRD